MMVLCYLNMHLKNHPSPRLFSCIYAGEWSREYVIRLCTWTGGRQGRHNRHDHLLIKVVTKYIRLGTLGTYDISHLPRFFSLSHLLLLHLFTTSHHTSSTIHLIRPQYYYQHSSTLLFLVPRRKLLSHC